MHACLFQYIETLNKITNNSLEASNELYNVMILRFTAYCSRNRERNNNKKLQKAYRRVQREKLNTNLCVSYCV